MSSRLIAHQIMKVQHSEEVRLHKRSSLLPAASDPVAGLLQQLREAITRRNPMAGAFTEPAGAGTQPPFQQRVLRYLSDRTDGEFISFSHDTTDLLADTMKRESLATGGYVVFAEHEHMGEIYLLVAILSTRAEPSFDKDLNLISAVTLDFDHLRHAVRLRETGIQANSAGAIHFVTRRLGGLSDYFLDFLGCETVTDPAAQGNNLHTALDQWATSQNLPEPEKEQVMQKTYTYWQTCRTENRPMTLTGLANTLYPDNPAPILSYLGNESRNLAGEFSPPPAKIMRKFVKFTFSESDLKIEFDRNKWMNKITVSRGVVKIQDAPASLIDMINKEHGAA